MSEPFRSPLTGLEELGGGGRLSGGAPVPLPETIVPRPAPEGLGNPPAGNPPEGRPGRPAPDAPPGFPNAPLSVLVTPAAPPELDALEVLVPEPAADAAGAINAVLPHSRAIVATLRSETLISRLLLVFVFPLVRPREADNARSPALS